MKKIILYTKYDLKDFEFIKFDNSYRFENEDIKGSLTSFPTKEDAEKYFEWNGINLEIKDEFWEEMDSISVLGSNNNYLIYDNTGANLKLSGLDCLNVLGNGYFSK